MTLKSGPNLGLLVAGDLGEAHYVELMRQWRGLDALVQPVVKSATTTAPPGSPADGDRYLVPASGATGAWAGKANQIARWSTALTPPAWEFVVPKKGWRVHVEDVVVDSTFTGALWEVAGIQTITNANGTATRFPNRIQICQFIADVGTISIDVARGSNYYSEPAVGGGMLPADFIDIPAATTTLASSGGLCWATSAGAASATRFQSAYVMAPVPSTQGVKISLLAIGRW